jgi:hypothetical protein
MQWRQWLQAMSKQLLISYLENKLLAVLTASVIFRI